MGNGIDRTLRCHWKHDFNSLGDTGWPFLDDSMASRDLHSSVAHITYSVSEGFSPIPPVVMDRDTAGLDSAGMVAYATTPYRYHTFGMEWLPNEVRILYDSNVVRRLPDRLIPRNSPLYEWASTYARSPVNIHPAQFDMDGGPTGVLEKAFFEVFGSTCSGCWPIDGKPTAHHLIDYVKVWDLTNASSISPMPQH